MPYGVRDYLIVAAISWGLCVAALWFKRSLAGILGSKPKDQPAIPSPGPTLLPLLILSGWLSLGILLCDPRDSKTAQFQAVEEWIEAHPGIKVESMSVYEDGVAIDLMRIKYRRDALVTHGALHLIVIPLILWRRRQARHPREGGVPIGF